MKKLTIILLALFTLQSCSNETDLHKCNHDGECPNYRDYQIEINQDSIFIYDGERLVSSLPLGNDSLSNIILVDNE